MTEERGTDELTAFLAQRGDHLMRSAALLAGGLQAGEDLLQAAVERLLARWRRSRRSPSQPYLRRRHPSPSETRP
jgi:DNA-directed RNA polymerase specialized sigma24 family protein